MFRRFFGKMCVAGAAFASAQALAVAHQELRQLRTLEVPSAASWQHAETGMILPPRIGGFTRLHVRDTSDNETDVVATYVDRDQGMIALVYIYRSMTADVPLWFDRALAAIMLPQPGAAAPAITAFARPGASAPSGLRAATTDSVAGMRSTAIALAPLGPSWLAKVRLGARDLDPAALDDRLTSFIAALSWPAEAAAARAVAPVEPCRRPLRLRRARIVETQTEDVLMDAISGSLAQRADAGPPPVYCREPGGTAQWSVYRPNAATESYLIALDDAGIVVSVGEALNLGALLGHGSGRRRYAVTLLERSSSTVFPSFNRLPPPEQVVPLVRGPFTGVMTTTSPDR